MLWTTWLVGGALASEPAPLDVDASLRIDRQLGRFSEAGLIYASGFVLCGAGVAGVFAPSRDVRMVSATVAVVGAAGVAVGSGVMAWTSLEASVRARRAGADVPLVLGVAAVLAAASPVWVTLGNEALDEREDVSPLPAEVWIPAVGLGVLLGGPLAYGQALLLDRSGAATLHPFVTWQGAGLVATF